MIEFTNEELKLIFHSLVEATRIVKGSTLLVHSDVWEHQNAARRTIMNKICKQVGAADQSWHPDYASICADYLDWEKQEIRRVAEEELRKRGVEMT